MTPTSRVARARPTRQPGGPREGRPTEVGGERPAAGTPAPWTFLLRFYLFERAGESAGARGPEADAPLGRGRRGALGAGWAPPRWPLGERSLQTVTRSEGAEGVHPVTPLGPLFVTRCDRGTRGPHPFFARAGAPPRPQVRGARQPGGGRRSRTPWLVKAKLGGFVRGGTRARGGVTQRHPAGGGGSGSLAPRGRPDASSTPWAPPWVERPRKFGLTHRRHQLSGCGGWRGRESAQRLEEARGPGCPAALALRPRARTSTCNLHAITMDFTAVKTRKAVPFPPKARWEYHRESWRPGQRTTGMWEPLTVLAYQVSGSWRLPSGDPPLQFQPMSSQGQRLTCPISTAGPGAFSALIGRDAREILIIWPDSWIPRCLKPSNMPKNLT
ncbi:translation initiation factor IF-2-like [Vulpes lagopus]|uniref:translation initiation factor IF-2-like n=1 Tax=Vulpes lagopus TaxID=494514 RepID=UPI001BC92474|nr:translation initiation factor IF-2-like [Vulpes lagopus]